MRILATRLFVTNVELSIIYQVKIHIGTNGEISANFTLNASKGAALEVTLQSLNPEATITSTPLDNHETQEQPQSITYHFQTTFANLKKTLEGLKDSSLISMGFANDICHAVPILMTQSLGKLPKISIAADNIDENYVENLFSPLTTWSAKIDVIEDKRLFWFDPIFKPKARLRILTENEAHSLVKVYTHDFFVIFCRNDTYHLLTRNNSKIEQFDILTRSVKISTRKQLLSQLIGKNEKTLFNLKNAITGELILGEGIQASSLHEFVISPYLKEKYHLANTSS